MDVRSGRSGSPRHGRKGKRQWREAGVDRPQSLNNHWRVPPHRGEAVTQGIALHDKTMKPATPHIRAVMLAGLIAVAPMSVTAEVYKYRDHAGRIHLTDQPMRGDYQLLKVYRLETGRRFSGGAKPSSKGNNALRRMWERRRTVTPAIAEVAAETSLPPELLHAVVRAESAYDAKAVSRAGAVGLMQLMPATARRYGVEDRENPVQNLRGGAQYLRDLLEMFDQNLRLALAAYNAGENAVLQYGRQIPPYDETQTYVRRVIAFLNEHQSDTLRAKIAQN